MGEVVHALKPLPTQIVIGTVAISGPQFWELLQQSQAAGWCFAGAITLYDPSANAIHPFGVFTHDAPVAGDVVADFGDSASWEATSPGRPSTGSG